MDNVFEIKEQRPIAPVGWLETTLPKTVMKRLQNYIETAKKNPKNIKDIENIGMTKIIPE